MKKIFLTIIFFLAAVSIYARDYSHPVGYYRLQSNHSITTTLLGLEYSFEGVVADRWTLIGRDIGKIHFRKFSDCFNSDFLFR